MPARKRVVCIGDSCVDVYLPPVERAFLGGNAVNTAVALRRAGLPVGYAGVVGSDRPGQILLQRLRELGIRTTYTRVQPAPTNRSYVRPLPGGGHEFAHELNPPRLPLALSAAALRYILRQPLVHTNWLWPHFAAIPAFRLTPGLRLSVDYGHNPPRELLDRSLPFVSIAFFALPAGRAAEAPALAESIYARGPRLVVVTLGSAGSLAFDGRPHLQPALPVDPIDTLGAGDAFTGAFLAHHLLGRPIEDCLQAAARAAAETCAFPGAWPGAQLSAADLAISQENAR